MIKMVILFQASFKESYMAIFYDYFNEQKYADAVKNVSIRNNILSALGEYQPVP